MSSYRMDDGTIVDTNRATETWKERSDHDGNNYIGRSTGSQWHDQRLMRSRKGRYYTETISRYQGQRDRVEWVSPEEATRWLLLNDYDVPDELQAHIEEISE